MKTIPLWGAAALVLTALPVLANTVYECKDSNGRTVYVQNAGKQCKKADIGKIGIYSNTPAKTTQHSSPASAADRQNDASVPPDILAKRQEAQQQLDAAKKALTEGKQVRYGNERNYARYQERIQQLENAVKTAQQRLNELNHAPNSGSPRNMPH